jgi:hypothetical protein
LIGHGVRDLSHIRHVFFLRDASGGPVILFVMLQQKCCQVAFVPSAPSEAKQGQRASYIRRQK